MLSGTGLSYGNEHPLQLFSPPPEEEHSLQLYQYNNVQHLCQYTRMALREKLPEFFLGPPFLSIAHLQQNQTSMQEGPLIQTGQLAHLDHGLSEAFLFMYLFSFQMLNFI